MTTMTVAPDADAPPCSWCGASANKPGAAELEYDRFPYKEAACMPTHERLLIQSLTLARLIRRRPLGGEPSQQPEQAQAAVAA